MSQPFATLLGMVPYDRLAALAARQHGLLTRSQLLACGVSSRSIAHMVKTGKIERVRPCVYRLCGAPLTWRAAALAVVLSAGEGAALSHRSAAALWGLADHHTLTTVEITYGSQCRQPGVTVHRCTLQPVDRTVHDRIPVTSAARTLLDIAPDLDEIGLGKAMDDALRRRLTTLPRISSALQRWPNRRCDTQARSMVAGALALRGVGYDPGANDWELEMDRWFDQSGLPAARRQYRVRVDGRRYTLDRAIPELKVGIEWAGRGSHGTRSQFEYDSDRRSRLQAAGWRVLDFHYRSDPAFIIRTVLAVCEEQSRLLGRGQATPSPTS